MSDSLQGQESSQLATPVKRRRIWALGALAVLVTVLAGSLMLYRAAVQGADGVKVAAKKANVVVVAQIFVVQRRAWPETAKQHEKGTAFLQTIPLGTDYPHAILLRSPLMVGNAVNDGKLKELKSLAGKDAANVIVNGLTTKVDEAGKGSFVITVSFRGADAKDGVAILNAVIEAYRSFLADDYRGMTKKTESLLLNAKVILQDAKVTYEKELMATVENARLLANIHLGANEKGNVHLTRLETLESKKTDFMLRQAEMRARLQTAEKALKAGKDDVAAALLAPKPVKPEDLPTDAKKLKAIAERQITLQKLELVILETSATALDQMIDEEQKGARKLEDFKNQVARKQKQLDKTAEVLDTLRGPIQMMDLAKEYTEYSVRVLSPPQVKKGG